MTCTHNTSCCLECNECTECAIEAPALRARIKELETVLREIAEYVNPDASAEDDLRTVQRIAEDAVPQSGEGNCDG